MLGSWLLCRPFGLKPGYALPLRRLGFMLSASVNMLLFASPQLTALHLASLMVASVAVGVGETIDDRRDELAISKMQSRIAECQKIFEESPECWKILLRLPLGDDKEQIIARKKHWMLKIIVYFFALSALGVGLLSVFLANLMSWRQA